MEISFVMVAKDTYRIHNGQSQCIWILDTFRGMTEEEKWQFEIAARVTQARINAGFKNQPAAIERIGADRIPLGTLKGDESGNRPIKPDRLLIYERVYRAPRAWLLLGLPPAPKGILTENNHKSPSGLVISEIRMLGSQNIKNREQLTRSIEEATETASVTRTADLGDSVFAIRNPDNSMLARIGAPDSFLADDELIFDPDLKPAPGDMVYAYASDPEEMLFREYRERGRDNDGAPVIELAPLNVTYPSRTIKLDVTGTILGVLVKHARGRKRRPK